MMYLLVYLWDKKALRDLLQTSKVDIGDIQAKALYIIPKNLEKSSNSSHHLWYTTD